MVTGISSRFASNVEHDAATWACEIEDMKREFLHRELQEYSAWLRSCANIEAKYTTYKDAIIHHLSRGSAQTLEELYRQEGSGISKTSTAL